jgi:hypothetical protein
MSWTVVCFCGNIYTAPPDRCDVCQKGFDHATRRRQAPPKRAAPLPPVVTDTNLGPQKGHSCPARPASPPVVGTVKKTSQRSPLADPAGRDAATRVLFPPPCCASQRSSCAWTPRAKGVYMDINPVYA